MIRLLRNVAIGRLAMITTPKGIDEDQLNQPRHRDPNDPLDRVRMIFDRNSNGIISPELNSIYTLGFGGMFIGGIYGGLLYARMANWDYRECNEATLYDSSLAAKRLLQNATTVGFAKGAFKWGWRCGIFCMAFSGISTVVSAYRGKPSLLDFSVAGLMTGAAFKISLGLKGIISGGFFGTLIGTIGGAMILTMLKLTGQTIADFRNFQYIYITAREEAVHASHNKQLETKDILVENFPKSKGPEDYTLNWLENVPETSIANDNSSKQSESSETKLNSNKK